MILSPLDHDIIHQEDDSIANIVHIREIYYTCFDTWQI